MEFSSKVTRKNNFGRKGEPIKSSSVMEHMNYINDKREKAVLESQVSEDLSKQTQREKTSNMIDRQVGKRRIYNTVERVAEQARELIFREIMIESYKDSLVLDKWAIDDYGSVLENAVTEFIDNNGGYKMLKESAQETKSPLLKKMVVLIESTATRISDRILMEAKDNPTADLSKVDLSLTKDEKDDLDVGKSDLQLEEVTNVIKRKVVDVVKEEKERSAHQQEVEDELEEATTDEEDLDDKDPVQESDDEGDDTDTDTDSDDGDDVSESEDGEDTDGDSVEEADDYTEDEDEKPVKEAAYLKGSLMTGYTNRVKGIQESTLFNTMLQDTMHDAVNESVSTIASSNYQQRKSDMNFIKNHIGTIDPETDEDEYDDDMIDDEVSSQDVDEPAQVNLDLILADTISQYTVLEMFHTFKLKTLSRQEIRDYSLNKLNK